MDQWLNNKKCHNSSVKSLWRATVILAFVNVNHGFDSRNSHLFSLFYSSSKNDFNDFSDYNEIIYVNCYELQYGIDINQSSY